MHESGDMLGNQSGDEMQEIVIRWKNVVWMLHLLRLQWALIVRLVLRVNWWQVLEEVEVPSVARDDFERLM